MPAIQLIATSLALLGVGALFGASLYDAVVLAPNLRGGQRALEHGRSFMANATPANLFRVLAPLVQLLVLVAVAVNWGSPQCRWPLAGALLLLVLCDVLTFRYHYPRLRLMFTEPLAVEPQRLLAAARQWAGANLIRVALLLGSWLSGLTGLVRLVHQAH